MDYIVQTNFTGPNFVMVPNHVAQGGDLSPEALGVLVYLASQPNGFTARVSVICDHFKMGVKRWQRIARELRACGAMDKRPLRGAGGKVYGWQTLIDWPPLERLESGATVSVESPDLTVRAEKALTVSPSRPKRTKDRSEKDKRQVRKGVPYKDEKLKKGPPAVSLDFEKMTAWQVEALRIGTITCGLARGSQALADAQAAARRWQSEQTDRRHAAAGGEVLRKGACS